MNRKGQVGAVAVAGGFIKSNPIITIAIVLGIVYLILFIFSLLPSWLGGSGAGALLSKINFFLIVILYIGIQVGFVKIFMDVTKFVKWGIKQYRKYILNWEIKIDNLIAKI